MILLYPIKIMLNFTLSLAYWWLWCISLGHFNPTNHQRPATPIAPVEPSGPSQTQHKPVQRSAAPSRTDPFPSGMLLVSVFSFSIPVSLILWLFTLLSYPNHQSPSPVRWLLAIVIPLLMAKYALARKSLDLSGAFAAMIIGFILTLSNFCFIVSTIAFFFVGSRATKFRSKQKEKIEDDHKEGEGQRNFIQVICNGGPAAEFALLYLLERGIAGEVPLDYRREYNATWYSLAVLASLACACGDTLASELGAVLSTGNPRLITDLARFVPRGTNGGVSGIGLLVSALGGVIIGVVYYVTLIVTVNRELLLRAPLQWPAITIGAMAGLGGSLIDSLIGATFQYSGVDQRTKKVVEQPGPNVDKICGRALLDNHSVNLISSLLTGVLIANYTIHYFEY